MSENILDISGLVERIMAVAGVGETVVLCAERLLLKGLEDSELEYAVTINSLLSFTPEEIAFMQENTSKLSIAQMTKSLKKPFKLVKKAMRSLCVEYIKTHWESQTDVVLAESLKIKPQVVRWIRNTHGLYRKRGPKYGPPPDTKVVEYIALHWLTQTDSEMAEVLGCKSSEVGCVRRSNGLHRKRGMEPFVHRKLNLNKAELEDLLKNQGCILEDVGKIFKITRERVRQIAKEMGIKTSSKSRSVLWYAHRYKLPEFADKTVFEQALYNAGSNDRLAKSRMTSIGKINRLLKCHGIRSEKAEYAVLMCSNPKCGKSFSRLKSVAERTQTKDPTCSHKCRNAMHSGLVAALAKRGIEYSPPVMAMH